MVVMADADLDLAVEGALFSGFGTAGQRCTSLGTVWAQREVYDEFRRRFVAAVESAVVGDPTADVLYGPMISERYLAAHERNLELVQPHHAVHGSTGVGRITSANPRKGFVGDPERGVFAHPTVVEGVRPGDALYDTETFGPLVGLGSFATSTRRSSWPTVMATACRRRSTPRTRPPSGGSGRGSRRGWSASTTPPPGPRRTFPSAATGAAATAPASPGVWVLDQFTRWQSVNWDYSGHLQKAQMDVAAQVWDTAYRI